jgi:hypothetical protein
MKRLVTDYSSENCPVRIEKLACEYQSFKEAPSFSLGKKEGIGASVQFTVEPLLSSAASDSGSKDDSRTKSKKKNSDKLDSSESQDIEAVEFTFVLFDIFDKFLGSIQGLSGPGKFPAGKKKYRSNWIFDLDGGFSQYHALGFPSQIRFMDGRIWRCDRADCVGWINENMHEAGVTVSIDDIFPDSGMQEGMSE